MKRLFLLLISLLAAPLAIRAQPIPAQAATPLGFVTSDFQLPPGGLATGDLNGDGRPDAALVLDELPEPGLSKAHLDRVLLVVWGRADGSYRRALTDDGSILCATCGGALGNPFEQLVIARGVLSIVHRGGSREAWRLTAKFRYQRGDFYQIGETYDVTDRLGRPCPRLPGHYRTGSEHRDVNLLTGQYERVKVSEQCKFMENKRGRQPVKPLVRLLDYQPAP